MTGGSRALRRKGNLTNGKVPGHCLDGFGGGHAGTFALWLKLNMPLLLSQCSLLEILCKDLNNRVWGNDDVVYGGWRHTKYGILHGEFGGSNPFRGYRRSWGNHKWGY